MQKPRLLEGTSYPIMLRNLWRLLATGTPMAEARTLVLTHARVAAFPDPPARSPTFETLDTSAATIH